MTSLYRLALRAFPARHRAAYAGEMVEAFEGLLATRCRDHGRLRALRFVLAACGDAVKAGLDERRRHRLRDAPVRGNLFGAPGRDLAHALRSLSKARGFSLVSISVALLAGLPAARRAAAVEPIIAMRAE